MPIQAPQWTDYLSCPVCCREFGPPPRSPISLGCGHTLCHHCLKSLHKKQCPFDQTVIQSEPEELVVNTALLQLAGYEPPAQPLRPPCIQVLPDHDKHAYDEIVRDLEHLAVYLKLCGSANNGLNSSRLSRPMQKKLVTLLLCSMTDEEGRGRAARAARSLGERTVTELILQHQNPQQLSANLWAAVRARGCQFLGPAMQEEVLKLVLLALEDGSALSRKVLVMFVVQRLEPHFPQASKTSIGHVVQLLYRASCFKVSKRECDSSLMQLKDEFRTYGSLRREHDAQIVQIASEAGLRIAPDQWSSLLYGDTAHKSHMQSIIDKLQTPQSFAQSVQDLFIALQRTGDPAQFLLMSIHLDRLANIDVSPDQKNFTLQELAELINSTKEVVSGLIHYLQKSIGCDSSCHKKSPLEKCEELTSKTPLTSPLQDNKMPMCRVSAIRAFCPSGDECPYLHFDEEFERIKAKEMEEKYEKENAVEAPAPFDLAPQRPVPNQGIYPYGYAPQGAGPGSQLANCHPYVYMTQVPAGPGVPIGPAVAQRLVAVPGVPSMPGVPVPRVAVSVSLQPQHVFPRYPMPQLPRLRYAPVEQYNGQHVPANVHTAANHQDQRYENDHHDAIQRPNYPPVVPAGLIRMAIINPYYPAGVMANNISICISGGEFLQPRYRVVNNQAYRHQLQNMHNMQPRPARPVNAYVPPAQLQLPAYNGYAYDDAPARHAMQPNYNVPMNLYGNEQHRDQNWPVINNVFNENPPAAAAYLRAEQFANRANEMFSHPPSGSPPDMHADFYRNRVNHM